MYSPVTHAIYHLELSIVPLAGLSCAPCIVSVLVINHIACFRYKRMLHGANKTSFAIG